MKALAWTRCAFAATVFGNISLSEATTISYTAFFLDERIGAAGSTGERLQIEAGVSDPFGVPSNISRVFATHSGTGSVVNLPYAGFGNFTSPTFSPYFATPLRSQLPFGARTGQFDISVQNSQGQTINARTQTLTATNPLTHARNITISGPSLSPTVSWSSISGADRYELRVWNAGGALIYDSPDSNTSLFNIPAGTLTAGSTYSLGIFSKDYDKFGSLERRSLTFKPLVADAPIKPTPLIPKDEELLLLATSANSTGPVGGFSEIANVRNVTDGYHGQAGGG